MARAFKSLLGDDIKNTRTLLHEAIPITGTISSGTYTENNIKTFTHGMFQSTYDYPYLSSSANHIFDVTYGHSTAVSSSAQPGMVQNAKKTNIYNQMAQVLMGYNTSGSVRRFDSDGTLSDLEDDKGLMDHCFFLNFTRLLSKDEVKKNSFRLGLYTTGSCETRGAGAGLLTLGDYDAGNEYRTSPAGDYGLIFSASGDSTDNSRSVGLVFYQAGIAVLTSSVFINSAIGFNRTALRPDGSPAGAAVGPESSGWGEFGQPGAGGNTGTDLRDNPASAGNHKYYNMMRAKVTGTIETLANGFRNRLHNIEFNNTIELNSTIYFCRINHNEFNYSSNPTFVSGSKLVVKNTVNDLPVTYITTVGLYSPDNELMAVAKLSEPIRKDPNTELTLRVRLDY